MTVIREDSPKVQYYGPFVKGQLLPLTFPYINKNDIKMIIDGADAAINVDYEIITEPTPEHPIAYPNSVYLKNALPTAKQITIYRETPLDQQAPFPQNSKFRSERIEQALDKICMQQQEQEEQLSRCVIAPITMETFNGQLPIPEPDAVLKWNTDCTALENYDIIGKQKEFEDKINSNFAELEEEVNNQISEFKQDVNQQISDFETETNNKFDEYRAEINENLEAVLDAANRLDELDAQVEKATTAATTATKAAERAEEVVANIEESRDQALAVITSTAATAMGDLEETAKTAITTVEASLEEYTEISEQIKADNSESSRLAREWAISEVIVDNTDYSAKYWAGKAKDNSGIYYDEIGEEEIDVVILQAGYVSNETLQTDYIDKETIEATYATNEVLETTYATKEVLETTYATKEVLETTYVTNDKVASTYATKEVLETAYTPNEVLTNTYATKEALEADYMTKAAVETTYATKEAVETIETTYATKEAVETTYATKEAVEATYATKESLDSTVGDISAVLTNILGE